MQNRQNVAHGSHRGSRFGEEPSALKAKGEVQSIHLSSKSKLLQFVIMLLLFWTIAATGNGSLLSNSTAHAVQSGPASPDQGSHQVEQEDSGLLYQRFLRWFFSPVITLFPPEKNRLDLGFANFFSYGWTQGWAEPDEGPNDAPRFRLLKIQLAFGERELRNTYNYTFGAEGGSAEEQEIEFELELPVSRRFLVEFEWAEVGLKRAGTDWQFRGGDLMV